MKALLLVSAVLAVVAVSWGVVRHGPTTQPVTEHPVTVPQTTRTISVSTTMPRPSTAARHLSAMLERGVMPRGRTMAEVMSDTDCAPDARMISHCRNEVRMPDGTTLVLRHPHDMRTIPCLAPGEQVVLEPADT